MIVSVLVLTIVSFSSLSGNAQNLGGNINTEGDEYINYILPESKGIVFTRRNITEFVYTSEIVDDDFMPAKPLNINCLYDRGIGAACFTSDLQRMYFVGIDYPDGLGRGDIYYSDYIDNQWVTPVNIGKPINSVTMESQPYLSADGKELYFVRDTRQYKSNLYFSRCSQGEWSVPTAIGVTNTRFGEMSPFVNSKGTILYFASEGHDGMGGYDIFMCRRLSDGSWGEPENLGEPINSSKNEISFRVSADGRKCYVSSDREGGIGGFDIYIFDFQEVDVPTTIDTTPFVMRDIHFEFDSSTLMESSYLSIDSLANYLKDNMFVNIHISGFTDDSGTDEHNLKLSVARAESVKNALVSRGVADSRISVAGYGAEHPVAPNDNESDKAKNRRVEVSLLLGTSY